MSSAKAEKNRVYDFDIPKQGIESALNTLAGITSTLLLFPYETVQLEESNPVIGRCTLNEALSVMLHGTSLRGGLTESGVITISQNTNEVDGNKMKNNKSSRFTKKLRFRKKIIAAAVFSMCGAGSVVAQDEDDVLEEVVVTGIRASLSKAADVKRNDSRVVDAIVAEDIGKLPDNNIAEALQRVTGVSLNRDFGVGEGVSIRGLPQNRVELNGRTTIGDSRDGISLDDFPSSFLKAIEVVKSPTADMIEGALGGTVSLKTFRPIELDGLTVGGSLDAEYADKTEEWAPIVNASIGNNWDLGDHGSFGAILNVSYQDREIRQDNFNNNTTLIADENVPDFVGPSGTPTGDYLIRDQNTLETFVEGRERTAVNLSLQWAPASGSGNVYLDINSTDRSGFQDGNQILEVAGQPVFDERTTVDSTGLLNNYTLQGVFAIPKTWSEFRETESSSSALGFEWDFTDRLTVSGEISKATSDSDDPTSQFNLRPINRAAFAAYANAYVPGVSNFTDTCRGEFNCRHQPDLFFSQNNGDRLPSVVYSDPNVYLDPENLTFRAFWHEDRVTENDETAIRLDFDYDTGWDVLHKVKAGYRTTERDYRFTERSYRANDVFRSAFTDFGTAQERPTSVGIADIERLFPGSTAIVSRDNLFSQTGRSGQFDNGAFRVFRGEQLADADATFLMVQQLLAGTNLATTGTLDENTVLDQNSFRDITEDTNAFYITADIEYGKFRANIGARYVETDISSRSFEAGQLREDSNSYDDILPSININYEITDNTQIRFAAAEVMRRPDFNELSSALDVDGFAVSASAGSVELEPFRATQYDISLEHYFGFGNFISFALFYKDVESFLNDENSCVASPLTAGQNVTEWRSICRLDSPGLDNANLVFGSFADFPGSANVDEAGFIATGNLRDQGLTGIRTATRSNGENGSIEGFEIGYQQAFDFLPGVWSGFGIAANYTYADSEQPNGNQLVNISRDTINTQLYWEGERLQVRLAYNYRDRFLDNENERRVVLIGQRTLGNATGDPTDPEFDPTTGNIFVEQRGQIDFSASWALNDSITLVTNVTNLTEEPTIRTNALGGAWKYSESDRRVSFGVRGNF